MITLAQNKRGSRATSILLSTLLMLPLFAGCGRQDTSTSSMRDNAHANAPSGTAPAAKQHKLSNTQKGVIVLAGAAALYYLYNQHKHAQAQAGASGQYYLSKNGHVYYRDANHQVHWVTPPANGIEVPAQEAQRYSEYQGYDNRSTGRDLTSVPEAQAATY